MNRKQFILTIAFTIIFALLGGALSAQLFLGNSVFAQARQEYPAYTAKEFRLVDRKGVTRALLNTANNDLVTSLELMDRSGKRRMMIMIDDNGNPSAHFWDRNAQQSFNTVGAPFIFFWEGNARLRARLPELIKR